MFDDDGFGFEEFMVLGGIYLLADMMEKKERECCSVDTQKENPGTVFSGCIALITIIFIFIVFLAIFF